MFNRISFTLLTILFISACGSLSSKQSPDSRQTSSIATNGVRLWADNCARCHNMRPPESYSNAQWDVAVLHMRVRANLTADDANAIVKYLKSAN